MENITNSTSTLNTLPTWTRRNTRRRVVTPVTQANQHANAEGIVKLSFSNYQLHAVEPRDYSSKRNGLPVRKFYLLDRSNGQTIAVLSQCDIRDQILQAAEAAELGAVITVKNISGSRTRPDFRTGMTTIAATSIKLDYEVPEVIPETVLDVPIALIAAQHNAGIQEIEQAA